MRTPMNSAISSMTPKTIAMPTRTSRKISALSPRALNNVAYSIEGRVSTSISPVRDFPVCQSIALNRVANGMCLSKLFAGGGTRPASTLEFAFSPDRLTVAFEYDMSMISLFLSGTEEDLGVRGELLDAVSDSVFLSSSGGITVTDPNCDVASRSNCGVTGTLEIKIGRAHV